jgi:hypothetical protein
MSLWLQSSILALQSGDYERYRRDILPMAPIPLPECFAREVAFGERRCRGGENDRLFPIRFLWLLECLEQRNFGYPALGRSRYHPERTIAIWESVLADPEERARLEADGMRFDLEEKAINLIAGWLYLGDRFVEDFLEIERVGRAELLFRLEGEETARPAFVELKRRRAAAGGDDAHPDP